MAQTLLTFTSDFGTREQYVGAVKGVVLSINPDVRLVDLSHEVPSHDVLAGAFTVVGSCPLFPSGTVHLVVVDPGVGSERRGIIASTERHLYVAPDNGVLSLLMEREHVSRVVSIEAEHYYRQPVSATFHARDIFGPVAAYLSKGVDILKFGPEISDYKKLVLPARKQLDDGSLEGFILHIDKFGNATTSFTPADLPTEETGGCRGFRIGDKRVERQVEYYSDGAEQEAFYLTGSSGYVEIAAFKQSAARLLGLRRGMKVTLVI
ncbi:MAG: SAM-dependent chlorinase/fluorinase [Acidobacteriota bacterium]